MRGYKILRPLFFHLPPETSHTLALALLKLVSRFGYQHQIKSDPCTVMGLDFPNRIGLAAGLDKNGDYIDALSSLGFGFIEVGTVTPKPQAGNPRPRLFRLPEAEAIINRMGFNNKGVDYLVSRLQKTKYTGILGINIGKNKTTPNEKAFEDYLYCFEKVYPFASYVTLNLSSPNTPGLRDLQFGKQLEVLLQKMKAKQTQLANKNKKYVPLVVKVSPDLQGEEIKVMASIFLQEKIDGVIATNTSIDHSAVKGLAHADEAGGLSGKVIFEKSNQVLVGFHQALKDEIVIIGVGGIQSAEDIKTKRDRGADLVQVYSGLIYEGTHLLA